MKSGLARCLLLVAVVVSVQPAWAQRERLKRTREILLERFDEDQDGRLSRDERIAAWAWWKELQGRPEVGELPALIDPESSSLYGIRPGSFEVQVARRLSLRVEGQGGEERVLQVRCTYPASGENLPVIVFSHGALGSKDAYGPLVSHWVSHGYVVLQPTHGDSLKLASVEEVARLDSIRQRLNSEATLKHWKSRPADVSRVLDGLPELEEQVRGLAGRMNRQAIGVGGHSFGAHTTMMIGGLAPKEQSVEARVRIEDPRALALLLISPQGESPHLDGEAFRGITRPTLVVTGSEDVSPRTGQSHEWRLTAFDNLPPGHKRLLFIEGAHHGFGGISGTRWEGAGPDNEDHVNLVRSVTLAFWDAELKNSAAAQEFLETADWAELTHEQARVLASP